MPYMKIEDTQYFSKLLEDIDEELLPAEEQKEREIMRMLLKIKNGTPPMRKSALRKITDRAREFGADALFNQILPLLMSPTLEDQERHLLVKVIDRVLYKLDDLVRPYVHKVKILPCVFCWSLILYRSWWLLSHSLLMKIITLVWKGGKSLVTWLKQLVLLQ
jgi:splicing factor 3B subunit 1